MTLRRRSSGNQPERRPKKQWMDGIKQVKLGTLNLEKNNKQPRIMEESGGGELIHEWPSSFVD